MEVVYPIVGQPKHQEPPRKKANVDQCAPTKKSLRHFGGHRSSPFVYGYRDDLKLVVQSTFSTPADNRNVPLPDDGVECRDISPVLSIG